MICRIILSTISEILFPLTHVINFCIKDGIFPEQLKVSKVCPIYKKGDKNYPASYRPVSIVPVISKVFEYVVYRQVYDFFVSNNYFDTNQFGFRRGQSTIHAVDTLVNEIHKVLEQKSYIKAVFCDLTKAFDLVDHNLLLEKLYYYGIEGNPLRMV